MFEKKLIIPDGNDVPESSSSVLDQLHEINLKIQNRISIMILYARKKGCPEFRCKLREFEGRLHDHVSERSDEYSQFNDPFIQQLAIQGEMHLSPEHRILDELFTTRATLLVRLSI